MLSSWSKRRVHSSNSSSSNSSSSSPSSSLPVPALDCDDRNKVPFVEIDGVSFYADRFYLTSSVYDDDDDDDDPEEEHSSASSPCTCGAKQALPLLNRSKLIQSLDLKAVIMATFSMNLFWLAKEFPSLFGEEATVPILLLHGDKKNMKEKESSETRDTPPLKEPENSQEEEEEEEETMSLCTQPEEDDKASNAQPPPSSSSSPAPPPSPRQRLLPSTVFVTQVLPTSFSTNDASPSNTNTNNILDNKGCLKQSIIERRKHERGVHHPKYMILLEASGDVVVLVSTANLTRPGACDATWIQRFPKASATAAATASRLDPLQRNNNNNNNNDFGRVLADFLFQQTLACQQEQLTPLGFVQRFCQWHSLYELARRFDFSQAQVMLVPTVPGKHIGRQRRGSSSNKCLYGRQRVAHILHTLSSTTQSSPPWLPKVLLSPDDTLVIQPTSLGADWKALDLTLLARSYLQHDAQDQDHNERNNNNNKVYRPQQGKTILQRMSVLWPTQRYIEQIEDNSRKEKRKFSGSKQSPLRVRNSPTTVASVRVVNQMYHQSKRVRTDHDNSSSTSKESSFQETEVVRVKTTVSRHDGDRTAEFEDRVGFGKYLYLSSDVFNTYEHCMLSQMAMFETSFPSQRPNDRGLLSPHIKSIARRYEGNDYALRQSFKFGKTQELFPWFLLTSASLSRGAQGCLENENQLEADRLHYANFELGVLFCSRLQGIKNTDRLYCWKPSECTCRCQDQNATRLIHLPVPYNLRPTMYQLDPSETEFCETPFFHEIPQGTATVGNMKLTPYGKERLPKA